MPRVLTEQHKAALAEGRRRRHAGKRESQLAAIAEYESWVHREAQAYARLVAMREMYGPEETEAIDAAIAWREVWSDHPDFKALPPDKTWRLLTGRDVEEDDDLLS